MVYTVTFNPAIDYVVCMEEVRLGATNRSENEQIYFGGKGINVSVVLGQLGVASKALGFIAGFTGEAIEKGLAEMGIDTDFVRLEKGNSRINVKLKAREETELNGQGPDIDDMAIETLMEKLDRLKDGDILILAGSIPASLPSDIYERILERLSGKRIEVVVDAIKDLLLKVLKYKPFLIKPNRHELGEMFGIELKTEEEIEKYARRLQKMGAVNVLVSMAGDGALLIDEAGKKHRCGACAGTVKNSVGAGDSMVAGFVAGVKNGDYEYALRLGTAAGGATAFSDGLATKEKILEMLNTFFILEDTQWQRMIDELQKYPTEEKLWETVIACQGVAFRTYSGLPFTYRLRTGKNGEYTKELWIDRRENSKSLVWSSVLLAFQKVKQGKIVVKRPKELGDIRGISYIYALFLKFGLIEPYQNVMEE